MCSVRQLSGVRAKLVERSDRDCECFNAVPESVDLADDSYGGRLRELVPKIRVDLDARNQGLFKT